MKLNSEIMKLSEFFPNIFSHTKTANKLTVLLYLCLKQEYKKEADFIYERVNICSNKLIYAISNINTLATCTKMLHSNKFLLLN